MVSAALLAIVLRWAGHLAATPEQGGGGGFGATPTTTLVVALFGFLGVTVAPIAIAVINRGGKTASRLELPPEVAMPRPEYDALVEILAQQDESSRVLERQLASLRSEYLQDRDRWDCEERDLRTEQRRLLDEIAAERAARVRAETLLEAHGLTPSAEGR